MIVQSTRISRTGGSRLLERHLLDKYEENERVTVLAGDRGIFADAQALADAKGCKYSLRHLSISPDTTMSPSQLADFVRAVDAEFGIGVQRPRLVVLHQKHGRVHFHLAVAEVDPVTNRVLGSRHDYARLERLAREYEAANGERVQMSRAERVIEKVEGFSSSARHKAERISSAFDRTRLKFACANGATELQAELQRQGLSVTDGEKGFILVTSDGQFVAAAHRATGLRKNEFKTIWGACHHEIKRPYVDGNATGHSSHSKDRSLDCRQPPGRNRQAKFAAVVDHATPNPTDRALAQPLRTHRPYYSPLASRRAQRALLTRSLTDVDWDELLRWAEELTAALMRIVIAPRQLLSARIHQARNSTLSDVNMDKSIGLRLRPVR